MTPKQIVREVYPQAECWQSYKDWPEQIHIVYFRLSPRHKITRWPTGRQAWADAAARAVEMLLSDRQVIEQRIAASVNVANGREE